MDIDLNAVDDENEEPELSNGASVCLELWHACAGPLVWLPRKGSAVVYFPQGHAEYLRDGRAGCLDLPANVFCRVFDVQLHAEVGNDEVYARLSLVAEDEVEQQPKDGIDGEGEVEDAEGINKSSVPHVFCKTLTASDTSTHGGFSVPRRAAEDCFPPLDYNQQRPSQELIAKDLHGREWKFRHIYRGQPRRHLLTSGWSAFINRKKLVSGDAVLFLRGNDGELRLGIRRAAHFKSHTSHLGHCSVGSNIYSLATVTSAVSRKNAFHVYYNPRACSSNFIVPYWKFMKSLKTSLSVGTRFKIHYEGEESAEKRLTGLITGIGDLDPVRWPDSKWRCLTVKWDDKEDSSRPNKISPWEIVPTGSVLGSTVLSAAGSKRTKLCLPLANTDFPDSNGNGCLDLEESARFHKVLQGQEFMGFFTPNTGIGVTSRTSEIGRSYYPDEKSCFTGADNCQAGSAESRVQIPFRKPEFYINHAGFNESVRFQRVLQGQEVFPKHPPNLGAQVDAHRRNGGLSLFNGVYASDAGMGFPSPLTQDYKNLVQPFMKSIQVSSPSSVLMFQEASSKQSCPMSVHNINYQNNADNGSYLAKSNYSNTLQRKEAALPCWNPCQYLGYESVNQHVRKSDMPDRKSELTAENSATQNCCRLFGFSLMDRIPADNTVEDNLLVSSPSTEVLEEASVTGSLCPRSLVGTII